MSNSIETFETEVLIIGGGVTGTGVMRDLALRGIHCLLIDRQDLNAGASGGNHGLLHSGGRYASADSETAIECRRESEILKRVAAQCIDDCGGLFVAVDKDDAEFAARFPAHCRAAGIDVHSLSPAEARSLEPGLSNHVFSAYSVPDATIDPFRIALENVHHAQLLTGCQFLPHTELIGVEINDDVISTALCRNTRTGTSRRIIASQFVNAGGAWAMQIARMAGCLDIDLLLSKGTLIISNVRVADRVINRLRPSGNGDILVPGGTVSVLGTTSDNVASPENIHPTVAEVECNLEEGTAMLPGLAQTRFVRAFAGVRPLLPAADAGDDGRQASRGFRLFDHHQQVVSNLATIVGGKLTTFRLMAEKTGDMVARRLGNMQPCKTAIEPLPAADPVRWTKPGFSARHWYRRHDPADLILCECEMVPQSAVAAIVQTAPGMEKQVTMRSIGVRSRVGKGSCQGAFCSIRLNSYLYDQDLYDSRQGLSDIRQFVSERFKGVRPVLWGEQMPQMELAEALHCGLMGLDLLEEPMDCPE